MLTHDRLSRMLLGLGILAGIIVSHFTPWGFAILAAMGVNLVHYGLTGRCYLKSLFDHMGVRYEHPPQHLVIEPKPEPQSRENAPASFSCVTQG